MGQFNSREDAVNILSSDLSLKENTFILNDTSIKRTNAIQFTAVVGSNWLYNLSINGNIIVDEEYDSWLRNTELVKEALHSNIVHSLYTPFKKVVITVIKKDKSFILKTNSKYDYVDDSLFDFLSDISSKKKHYLQQYLSTNFGRSYKTEQSDDTLTTTFNINSFKQILKRICNVRIIDLDFNEISEIQFDRSSNDGENTHFLPIIFAAESLNAFYLFEPSTYNNLQDCLWYSPSVLGKNHSNLMFLVYQLLDIFISLKKLNLKISTDISLCDFSLYHNSLWLSVSPTKCLDTNVHGNDIITADPLVRIYQGINTDLTIEFDLKHKLSDYTHAWSMGKISNFDYLFIINLLAGRKFGDPSNHPVFPWVTDFSSKYKGLRDLKKSKFRLTKGDRQLDATYSAGIGTSFAYAPVQHHVSDVLSDITYYIYHARTTTKELLCHHVRSRWVPDEYPSTLQRMYYWTPDECIPEFFYDPSIFKSIHNDLPDLGWPNWINSAEEFVDYHFHYLESNKVSNNLHHWIDLVFGYKLSGKAAKLEKNVHLSLVDHHSDIRNYGVVQLFSFPHPECLTKKDTDDFDVNYFPIRDTTSRSNSWEYVDFTTSIIKSRGDVFHESKELDEPLFRKKAKTFYEGAISITNSGDEENGNSNLYQIQDVENIDFMDDLEGIENMLNLELSVYPLSDKKSIGRFEFGSLIGVDASEYDHVDDDMKLFICLLIEIVLEKEMRTRTYIPKLDERFLEDICYLHSVQYVPRWIKSWILDALDCNLIGDGEEHLVSYCSLSKHMNGFNFPKYFEKFHEFLSTIMRSVEQFSIFPSEESQKKLTNEIQNHAQLLPLFLDELDFEGADMLQLYLDSFFKCREIQIPMFLYIFPQLCLTLGPIKSHFAYIKDLQRVYDSIKTVEEIMLLQKTFLSHALSSFGLECFLSMFMSVFLDVLLTCQIELFPVIGPTKLTLFSTTLSRKLSSNSSLTSYEISPKFDGDTESISSYNLDDFFKEGCFQDRSLMTLSKEYTSNISDMSFHSLPNNEIFPTSSPQRSISLNSPVETTSQISAIDTQELESSNSSTIVSISTINELLPTSFQNVPFHELIAAEAPTSNDDFESAPDILCSIQNEYLSKTNSPFLLLSDKKDNANLMYESKGTLENAPLDEDELISYENGKFSNIGVCETIVQSVKWLIPSLGPLVSTEYVATPLIRSLSKILLDYDGIIKDNTICVDILIDKISPTIDCLVEIALVYGDNILYHSYLPYVSKLIMSASSSSVVSIAEGSKLISSVQLLVECFSLLKLDSILNQMEAFSVDFVQPLIRLLASLKCFAAGNVVRKYLSRKLIDILGLLSQRINREVAQELMAPLLQQFFSCFDGIYTINKSEDGSSYVSRKMNLIHGDFKTNPSEKNKHINILKNTSKYSKLDRITKNISIDDVLSSDTLEANNNNDKLNQIFETFSISLAYHAYVLFCRVLGNIYIEKTLYNSELIVLLCSMYDDGLTIGSNNSSIEAQEISVNFSSKTKWLQPLDFMEENERLTTRSSWQHIEGNWLDHWQENLKIGSSDKLCFVDRKLQAYAGHSSVIRDIYVPDNEHFFLSASRDKTVKFWLLKNHGNGTSYLGCRHTYSKHTRPVFAVQGIESKRLVASCDGAVHIWDQMTGDLLSEFDVGQGNSITCIRTLPSPSTCCAVATTDGHIQLYDIRQRKSARIWKVSSQTNAGMVRCMCVNDTGSWISAGFSGGIVSVLDYQAGTLRGQTRVHDAEIIQMEPIPGYGFVSSSVDSNLRIWNDDGSVSHVLRSPNDHIHSLMYYKQQLIWGTSSNKITIHCKEKMSSFETMKINQDVFKGTLSKMVTLPVSGLYLLGTDSGNVALYG